MFRPPPIRFYNPRQLRQQANRIVRSSIAAEQAPIKTAQALAASRALQQQQMIAGFGRAAMGILAQSAPMAGQAYKDAATAEGQLAGGLSQGAAAAVQQRTQASQAMIDRLAPGGALAPGSTNPTGLSDTLYTQGALIPGAASEQRAAAAITQASEQPGIFAGQTENDIIKAQAKAAADDQQYTQSLLDLAAKEPALRQQIMDELQKNEMSKRSAWVQEQAQAALTGYRGAEIQQGQQRLNQSARRIAIAERQGNARIALQAANLRLAQARDRQSVRQALIQGQRIDSSASHAAGYLIDRNGDPILGKGGNRIPVHTSSGGGAKGVNTGPGSTAWKEAYRYAHSNYLPQYITPPSGNTPGVLDPTWSQPKFPRMQSYLMQAYGLNRAQARKLLVGLGIKPNGKRP
jgi:hypothetical protein